VNATTYGNANSIAGVAVLPFAFKIFGVSLTTITANVASTALSFNVFSTTTTPTGVVFTTDTTPLGIIPSQTASAGQQLFATAPVTTTVMQTALGTQVYYPVPGTDGFDGILAAATPIVIRCQQSGTATTAGVYTFTLWGVPFDVYVTKPEIGPFTGGAGIY
jgi:hypothetical protein